MVASTRRTLIRDVRVFNGVGDDLMAGDVLVEGDKVATVGSGPPDASDATVVDASGRTGGHGDFGFPYEPTGSLGGPMARGEQLGFTRVADGPDRVLAAVREQLKLGASQVKLMAGGGVQSFYDSLVSEQFTLDELRAAVDAAADWDTYVAVHVYNTEGVRRARRARRPTAGGALVPDRVAARRSLTRAARSRRAPQRTAWVPSTSRSPSTSTCSAPTAAPSSPDFTRPSARRDDCTSSTSRRSTPRSTASRTTSGACCPRAGSPSTG